MGSCRQKTWGSESKSWRLKWAKQRRRRMSTSRETPDTSTQIWSRITVRGGIVLFFIIGRQSIFSGYFPSRLLWKQNKRVTHWNVYWQSKSDLVYSRARHHVLYDDCKMNYCPKEKKSKWEQFLSPSSPTGPFKLEVEQGDFTDSEIVVMLGENGTGKTTFIKMLAGITKPTTSSMFL